ncbi:transketolase [Fulvimarina sp. 2208YS6-2-32]|uniref:Transketolase n=1 Tax=Fulvimarina uroteuthidis TaxID=3098149 RepID=A0ABU5I4G0_9HYPH|nr:transketolase [Fulvimarina sp. 2208YS6-2-32]MDY8110263.1 transketolase [Fulvimarina sp. 2208YS6-2-32]
MTTGETARDMANAIRFLSADAVENAASGHPGLPLGAADIATVLMTRFMTFDPTQPDWPNRDRFVFSAGHGSMLLYSLLYLLGYKDIGLDEIRTFRRLGSKAAGHPEYGHAAGIETTTGPLGQGIANAVGMAIAERHLSARFGEDIVDHRTYVLAGDGCLMEGISQEAISLAGHLKLSKLVVLWDDNGITIDGKVSLADSTDQIARFEACGWSTFTCDGHDQEEIAAALEAANASDRPSLVACRTTIGFGASTKAGTAKAHGSPLGTDEIKAMRETLGWPHEPFEIPATIVDQWRIAGLRSSAARRTWDQKLSSLDAVQRGEFDRVHRGDLPSGLKQGIERAKREANETRPDIATRKSSELSLAIINELVPETIGGSADLTGSNNTLTGSLERLDADNYGGRYLHYGIREHAMAGIMNGMALHGGVIPYGGTFLVFSDYARGAIRLSALMGIRTIYVLTHDSIGLGEDGPTHQPVEHLAALRAIPNLAVMRPADYVETLECWDIALQSRTMPSVLALSRQNVPALRTDQHDENRSARGAYELASANGEAAVTLFATGSEVQIAIEAKAVLDRDAIATRVVSVPCFELFERQSEEYRAAFLDDRSLKVAIEAGVRQGWDALIGRRGLFVGMDGFGASGRAGELYAHFGITTDTVVSRVRAALAATPRAEAPQPDGS